MALQLLAEDSKGGVLSLDSSIPLGTDSSGNQSFCSVRDILFDKHPYGRATAFSLIAPLRNLAMIWLFTNA